MVASNRFGSPNPAQSSPFGSNFGQTQPAFGSQPIGATSQPAFGSTSTPAVCTTSTPTFGSTSTPTFFTTSTTAFGSTSNPAFHTRSTPTFGSTRTPAFGTTSTPAFGSTSTPAFGTSTPAFGCTSTPVFRTSTPAFGCTSTPVFGTRSTPAFGSTTNPAFGIISTPVFGSTTTPAFGTTSTPAFGSASTPAFHTKSIPYFGSTSTPAFCTTSTPAFGSTSTPAFGTRSTPAFGSTSTPAFGTRSTPAFGALSTPAFGTSITPAFGFGSNPSFGESAPAFGTASIPALGSSPSFGRTPSPFGAQSSAFGVQSTTPMFGGAGFRQTSFGQRGGSRVASYTPTNEIDTGSSVSGLTTPGKLLSISAMPQYQDKSHEELRWEDNQSGSFGSNLGQTQPAFGSQPFGATSQPAFGSTGTPAFGTTSTPVFGVSSTPAFGASSTPAFGFGSTPGFGKSAPAFGAASIPAYGSSLSFGSTLSPFGDQNAAFGFGQTSFGGQRGGSRVALYTTTDETDSGSSVSGLTTPGKLLSISAMPQYQDKNHEELRWEDYQSGPFGSNFGQTQPAYGSQPFGATSQPMFGSTGTPAFDTRSRPVFGVSSTPAFGTFSTPVFEFGSTPAFGKSVPAFGAASIPAYGSSLSFGSTLSPFGDQNSAFVYHCFLAMNGSVVQSTTLGWPGFGQTSFGGRRGGSRVALYTTTNDADSSSSVSGLTTPGELLSISAMPQYQEKSHEELRWEDYQSGDKGGLFSQPTQSSPFGQTTSSAFGQTTSAFGQTTSAFGQASSVNPFYYRFPDIFGNIAEGFGSMSLGSSSGAAFSSPLGATSLSSPFGTVSSSPSLFGSSTTTSGGASSASPFGTSSSPEFGSTPFGQDSQPGSLFCSTPSLISSPAFGSSTSFENTQSSELFESSTPALGRIGTVFGQFTQAFGQTTPAFGQTTNVFGKITPSFGSNLFSNSTTSMMFQSKPAGLTLSMPSMFTGFQNPTPTQAQGGSFTLSNFGQPQPSGEMEASNFQISKVALGKQTKELEKENFESAITLIFQRMDKEKEIMEQLKEKVVQLTSYVQYLVGPIQSSAPMPTLPSWMEDLVVLGSKLIDEAVILYHKIHDELNNLADMNKKFDEELQGLEWSLPQIKEMMKIDFDILVAEEIFGGSDPSLPNEWLKATEWRIEILEEGKTRFKDVDGIAHDALVDILDFIEKIPCDFYDDRRSVNSAGFMKDQLAKVIKEEESVVDIAATDRLMKLKILCWNFEKKLIKCREVPSEVSNIHISQDMRFRYSKGPNQEAVKEAIDKFRQYQKRVCNNKKGTINIGDSQGECSH